MSDCKYHPENGLCGLFGSNLAFFRLFWSLNFCWKYIIQGSKELKSDPILDENLEIGPNAAASPNLELLVQTWVQFKCFFHFGSGEHRLY